MKRSMLDVMDEFLANCANICEKQEKINGYRSGDFVLSFANEITTEIAEIIKVSQSYNNVMAAVLSKFMQKLSLDFEVEKNALIEAICELKSDLSGEFDKKKK